ncbi:hypothetical protein CRM22_010840 [Opisthorchis felineus]|uniref:BAH domain-containing protein n=1 Tax=Opisthorchis felineus TaxID=147828 RepID=A0A4S2KL06_OPIFE|nr:hypothetical protein CRM22_010840 [Opisthorchis felineus]
MPDHHTEGTAKPLSPVAGLRKSLRARVATGTLKSHKTHGSNSGKNSVAKTRSRKHLLKKNPTKLSPASPLIRLEQSVIHKGTRFTVGDIVSIVDVSNESYYAQIRGLAVDHTGDSCCVLTWLVPTTESISDTFEPENYVIGLEEDVLRDISCCNLVCHCPADYFRPIASPYSIHSY